MSKPISNMYIFAYTNKKVFMSQNLFDKAKLIGNQCQDISFLKKMVFVIKLKCLTVSSLIVLTVLDIIDSTMLLLSV